MIGTWGSFLRKGNLLVLVLVSTDVDRALTTPQPPSEPANGTRIPSHCRDGPASHLQGWPREPPRNCWLRRCNGKQDGPASHLFGGLLFLWVLIAAVVVVLVLRFVRQDGPASHLTGAMVDKMAQRATFLVGCCSCWFWWQWWWCLC